MYITPTDKEDFFYRQSRWSRGIVNVRNKARRTTTQDTQHNDGGENESRLALVEFWLPHGRPIQPTSQDPSALPSRYCTALGVGTRWGRSARGAEHPCPPSTRRSYMYAHVRRIHSRVTVGGQLNTRVTDRSISVHSSVFIHQGGVGADSGRGAAGPGTFTTRPTLPSFLVCAEVRPTDRLLATTT